MSDYKIGGVPETMIQTLYARAKESKKKNAKIYDGKPIAISISEYFYMVITLIKCLFFVM